MFPPGSLALLALVMVDMVSSVEYPNCSYIPLLEHLNLLNDSVVLANVRPVMNWTTSTQVWVDMYVYGILDVNEKTQTLTCFIWNDVTWINEFISWNASDFCGIETVVVPRNQLWNPDIVIQEDISDTSSMKLSYYAQVRRSGVVTISHVQRLTTTCIVVVSKFPFDHQSCNISFLSLRHKDKIVLQSFSDSLSEFARNITDATQGEWELLSVNYTTAKVYDDPDAGDMLVYTINIARKPLLYVINLLVPLLFFLVLDLASFFISEDKLSFKVTILLSISVLLLILTDNLPSTAHDLPFIALYFIVVFALVGFGLLETMLVTYLVDLDSRVSRDPGTGGPGPQTNRSGNETQRSACTFERKGELGGQTGSGIGGQEDRAEKGQDAEAYPEKRAPDGGRLSLSDPRVLELVLEGVRRVRLEGSSAGGAGDQGTPGYWERVARRIDTAYFCVYLVTVTGFLLYLCLEWFS